MGLTSTGPRPNAGWAKGLDLAVGLHAGARRGRRLAMGPWTFTESRGLHPPPARTPGSERDPVGYPALVAGRPAARAPGREEGELVGCGLRRRVGWGDVFAERLRLCGFTPTAATRR